MSLEKLFEAVDEKVFTPELKETLETEFNEAVESKATEMSEAIIEEKIDSLNIKSEEHIDLLNEKAEEFVQLKETEMINSLDKYLDRIVEEFMGEIKGTLDESQKNEKSDLIIEAFNSMLISAGITVDQIKEAKDESAVQTKLDEMINKHDLLVTENIKISEENDKLFKIGIIQEMSEDLTIVESEKFETMCEMVEFSKDQEFVKRLEKIKKSVKGINEDEDLNEDVKDKDKEKPIWAHLV